MALESLRASRVARYACGSRQILLRAAKPRYADIPSESHDHLHTTSKPSPDAHLGLWLVLAGLFAVSLIWLHQIRHKLKRLRTLSRYKMKAAARASCASDFEPQYLDGENASNSASTRKLVSQVTDMILPLSAPNIRPNCTNGTVEFNGIPLDGQDLETDIKKLEPLRANWQQLLRAIAPHAGRIKRLWLIGSRGAASDPATRKTPGVLSFPEQEQQGSYGFVEDAVAVLRPYLPDCKFMKVDAEFEIGDESGGCRKESGVHFADTRRLLFLVSAIVERCRGALGHGSGNNSIIETTGGQKTTSIVGAALTLNDASLFQYVDTGTGEVLIYDMRLESPPEFH